MEPITQYFRAPDGVNIACWTLGEGFPLLIVPSPMFSNIQLEWQIPEFREWYEAVGEGRRLCGYDARGSGLSERQPRDQSLEAQVSDLEAAVERLGLERLDLFAAFHSGPIAITYAVRHPERVRRLILFASYATAADYIAVPRVAALRALLAMDWEAYVQTVAFYSFGMDERRAQLMENFVKETTTQQSLLRLMDDVNRFDVKHLLDKVQAPTLVIHRRKLRWPTLEIGQELAASIANARMVVVEGELQMYWGEEVIKPLLGFLEEADAEPGINAPQTQPPGGELTGRESEILRLVAQGHSNKEIAASLSVSVHTVERHLANVYAKIGARGRAGAISYAHKSGLA